MNRAARIQAAIAVALLTVPYLLLFAAGTVWLYQFHSLLAWAAVGGWRVRRSAFCCCGICGMMSSRHRSSPT